MKSPMTAKVLIAIALSAPGIVAAGWGAHAYLHDTFADKDAVLLAGNKADFVIDQQMAALIGQIAYLERKPNKTADELHQLNYLRQQLEHMRRVRAGK